jgi:hypothetical protein
MNANELADALQETEPYYSTDYKLFDQAATMLRQQQAEIAELKHMNRNWQISENILLLELEKLQHCELTDEEIIEIGNAVVNLIDSNEGWIEFARAILKKASEK